MKYFGGRAYSKIEPLIAKKTDMGGERGDISARFVQLDLFLGRIHVEFGEKFSPMDLLDYVVEGGH